MISHESRHAGEIIGFSYATDIQIPEQLLIKGYYLIRE